MAVPLLDLEAQHAPLRDALLSAITRVVDSQRFINGPEVESLEQDLAGRLGVEHAVAVSSGTDALLASLMAFGVGPGDEIVTSTYSFFATAGAITRLGAKLVLADIDADTYNIDPEAAVAAMNSRTKAVIPVHLFGQPADLHPLINGVVRSGAFVIEDAAQAIGATYDGHTVGTFGAFGCFSFFPSKNLGCFGEGGLVTTKNRQLARRIRLLRNHGMEPKYYHHMVGGNFRLDAIQAAVLRVKLPHLEAWTSARQRNAQRYRALFAEAGLTDVVKLPIEAPRRTHIYNQFVVRVSDRDGLRAHLAARGIGTEVYYPVPFHLQKCFAHLGYAPGAFPRAEAAAAETVALPIYGELTEAQQAEVVDAVKSFYRK